jgi:signal transduction histidine kinase
MIRLRSSLASVAATVFGLVLGASCSVLAASVSVLHATGHVSVPVWQVLLAGSPAAIFVAGLAAVAQVQTARAVRRMEAKARTVEALQRRVRIADEVAERHRRTAEHASAGMFELVSGLASAEEGARGQLSAELHDTVAQSLSAAQTLLHDPNDINSVQRATELVCEAEEQVRAVMARTTPPALRDGDLARAVAALRDDLRNRYGIEIELSWPAEAHALPLVIAITTYRFFQEGLLNVVKHAEVDRARAQLWVDDHWLIAAVIDDGPGFNPRAVRSESGRHVGLGLLRERARLIGGALDVSSVPMKGTTLTLRLPRSASPTGQSSFGDLHDTGWDRWQTGGDTENLTERHEMWPQIATG